MTPPTTISPACQDNHCEQCDGRVVINNDIYPCECPRCHHDDEEKAA